MYSRKLSNPLASKIEAIVAQKGVYGSVKHTDFNSVRNKSSVRAVLINMGFKPCNEVSPITWKLPKNLIGLEDESCKKIKAIDCAKKIKRSAGRPKTIIEMPTAKGQQILEQMKESGFYDVSDFDMSPSYLSNIISSIRELGYMISSTTGKNKSIVRYKLEQ